MSRNRLLGWLARSSLVGVLSVVPATAGAQSWGQPPDAATIAAMLGSLAPPPANASNYGDARDLAALNALRNSNLGIPTYWQFDLPHGRLQGAASIDGPVPAHRDCYFITYYEYDPTPALSELTQTIACKRSGQWLFSRIVGKGSLPPVETRRVVKCPFGRERCTRAEAIVDHALRLPTPVKRDRIATAQADLRRGQLADSQPAPSETPVQQPVSDPQLERVIDEILVKDSRSWGFNQYFPGNVSNARLESGNGKSFVARADYRFNGFGGPATGWVRVSFKSGTLTCLEFWDQEGVCRPLGYSLTSQIVAVNRSVPKRLGETDDQAYARLEIESDRLSKEYDRLFKSMEATRSTDRVASCRASQQLLQVIDDRIAVQTKILEVHHYLEQRDLLEMDHQIRGQVLEIQSLVCR